MTRKQKWRIFAPLGVCALLGLWIALSAANARAASFSIVIYGLANLIVYTDALDFALRLFMRRRRKAALIATADNRDMSIDPAGTVSGPLSWSPRHIVPMRPYAIVASVYNLTPHLEPFMKNYAPWRDKVWLISDGSTDRTVERLRAAGWRVFDDGVNRKKPGAIKRLLERLPPHIETVMVIDPDVRVRGRTEGSSIDLERCIADFQRSGAAACCPRIMIEPDGFLARFQAFEYALAFRIGRESLADYSITSGGLSIYKRSALEAALEEHSLSVYAEDFENAIILLARGESIYYDGRLVVSTEGPGRVSRWFSQRVGWYHGLLKVYAERLSEVWRVSRRAPFAMYHFIMYVGVLSLALHLVKMVSATLLIISFLSGFDEMFLAHLLPDSPLANPSYFISAVGGYLALGVAALFTVVPRAERAYCAPIVPLYLFYAIAHIAPMTVGFANWMALQMFGRRVYRDHYDTDKKHDEHGGPPGTGVTNRRKAA